MVVQWVKGLVLSPCQYGFDSPAWHWVKDLVLLPLWPVPQPRFGFDPGPGNFHMLWAWQKKIFFYPGNLFSPGLSRHTCWSCLQRCSNLDVQTTVICAQFNTVHYPWAGNGGSCQLRNSTERWLYPWSAGCSGQSSLFGFSFPMCKMKALSLATNSSFKISLR